MPVNINSSIYKSTPDTPGYTLGSNDSFFLGADIYVTGTGNSPGVLAGASDQFEIRGSIISTNSFGITSAGGGHSFLISANAFVFGAAGGINAQGGTNYLMNAGRITGLASAVTFGGGGNFIQNAGTMRGGNGADVLVLGGTGNRLENTGHIETSDTSVAVRMQGIVINKFDIRGGGGIYLNDGGVNQVNNQGDVQTSGVGFYALHGSAGQDIIANSGLLSVSFDRNVVDVFPRRRQRRLRWEDDPLRDHGRRR